MDVNNKNQLTVISLNLCNQISGGGITMFSASEALTPTLPQPLYIFRPEQISQSALNMFAVGGGNGPTDFRSAAGASIPLTPNISLNIMVMGNKQQFSEEVGLTVDIPIL